MAHNIATHDDGEHSCYSLRENPWHSLGTVVQEPVSNTEIVKLAGLDWQAEKVPLYTSEMDPVPNHVAIKRSDDNRVLGVVGKDYEPLQNHEMFDFFKKASGYNPIIETAGALGNGEIVWALASIPELNFRIRDDLTKAHMLISNGHIGNKGVVVQPTSVRVVCQNTLSLADKEGKGIATKIRHTAGMRQSLDDVARAYKQSIDAFRWYRQASEHLASQSLDTSRIKEFISSVFDSPDMNDSKRSESIRKNRINKIHEILQSPTSEDFSMFTLFHSAVELIDHYRPTKGESSQGRFASANFGSGAKLKQKAFRNILRQTA